MPGKTSFRVFVGALLVGLAWAGTASAETSSHARINLEYAAPDELSCPNRDAFASAMATRLGYEPVATEAAPDAKTLSVNYTKEERAVVVRLRLSNAAKEVEAEKKLVSETGACAELGAAAALAAAILLDPRVMFPRPNKPSPPGPALDSNAPGTWPWYEPRSPIPEPPPPPVTPWMWRVGLGAVGCAGCGPGPSIGAAIFFGASKGRLALDAGVRADLPTSTTNATGRTVSASLAAAEIFPHARLGPARIGLLGSVGTLFGESDGDKQASLWAGAGARAAIDWTFKMPVFLRVAVDGLAMLSRVSLRVEGVELWSTPLLAGALNLGVGAEF